MTRWDRTYAVPLLGAACLGAICWVLSLPPRFTDGAFASTDGWVDMSRIARTHHRQVTNDKLTRAHGQWAAAHPLPVPWNVHFVTDSLVEYRPIPYRQGLWNVHLADWNGRWAHYPPETKFYLLRTPELQVEVVGQKLRLHLAPNSHVEIRTDAPRFR